MLMLNDVQIKKKKQLKNLEHEYNIQTLRKLELSQKFGALIYLNFEIYVP